MEVGRLLRMGLNILDLTLELNSTDRAITRIGVFVFKKYTTPGTGKRWDLKASALYLDDWKKTGLRAMGVKA